MIDTEIHAEQTLVYTPRALRSFGLQLAGLVFAIFALLPFLRHRHLRWWPIGVAVTLTAWALLAPRTLRHLHTGWARLGHALGAINSRIILAAMFFLLITPMGLAMRACGRDTMGRKRQPRWSTYRVRRAPQARIDMQRLF